MDVEVEAALLACAGVAPCGVAARLKPPHAATPLHLSCISALEAIARAQAFQAFRGHRSRADGDFNQLSNHRRASATLRCACRSGGPVPASAVASGKSMAVCRSCARIVRLKRREAHGCRVCSGRGMGRACGNPAWPYLRRIPAASQRSAQLRRRCWAAGAGGPCRTRPGYPRTLRAASPAPRSSPTHAAVAASSPACSWQG